MKELVELFLIIFSIIYTVKIGIHLISKIIGTVSVWDDDTKPISIPFGDTSCLVYTLYILGWLLMLS